MNSNSEAVCVTSFGEVSIAELQPSDADLRAIGRLRYDVWASEGSLERSAFPTGVWVDFDDAHSRHWVARTSAGVIVGAARLIVHYSFQTSDRDVSLWKKRGRALVFPVGDLGRLVVLPEYRGRGIASALNRARVAAAAVSAVATLICTASAANRRLLLRTEGFEDIGEAIEFADRPGTVFYALERRLWSAQRCPRL
jgi:GNAT superfamily N-acetyltransferase